MDLTEAASSGSRLVALTALRDVLAGSILDAEPDKRAPLAARFAEVLEQIERLSPKAKAGDPVDQIAQRRAARGAGTAASKRQSSSDAG